MYLGRSKHVRLSNACVTVPRKFLYYVESRRQWACVYVPTCRHVHVQKGYVGLWGRWAFLPLSPRMAPRCSWLSD